MLCQDWLHNPKDKGLTPLLLFRNSTLGLESMGFHVPSYVKIRGLQNVTLTVMLLLFTFHLLAQKDFMITSCPRGKGSSNGQAHPSTQSSPPPLIGGASNCVCRAQVHLKSATLACYDRKEKNKDEKDILQKQHHVTHSHLGDGNQAFGTAGKVEAGGWEGLLCYLGTVITELQSSIIALQPTFQ